jgi:hypothetical protein
MNHSASTTRLTRQRTNSVSSTGGVTGANKPPVGPFNFGNGDERPNLANSGATRTNSGKAAPARAPSAERRVATTPSSPTREVSGSSVSLLVEEPISELISIPMQGRAPQSTRRPSTAPVVHNTQRAQTSTYQPSESQELRRASSASKPTGHPGMSPTREVHRVSSNPYLRERRPSTSSRAAAQTAEGQNQAEAAVSPAFTMSRQSMRERQDRMTSSRPQTHTSLDTPNEARARTNGPEPHTMQQQASSSAQRYLGETAVVQPTRDTAGVPAIDRKPYKKERPPPIEPPPHSSTFDRPARSPGLARQISGQSHRNVSKPYFENHSFLIPIHLH